MNAVFGVFRRELALAWSAGAGAAAPVGFFVGAGALLALTIGADRALLQQVGPPVLWIAAALSALMVLERLFQADLEEGGLDQMLLSPVALEWLIAAKAAALWTGIGAPVALAALPVCVMMGAPPDAAPAIALGLAIGMAAFIAAGLVGAAAAAGVKRAGVLIALLVLPFFAPPILFGAAQASAAAAGAPFGPAFLLLCGAALFALALGPIAAAAALRLEAEG